MCDGSVDVSVPYISDAIKKTIYGMEKHGIVEKYEAGHALTPHQQYRKYPSRYINNVQWSITGKCNYKCRHCYMSAHEADAYELPHESVMDIVNQLAECGVMKVMLTGGEPLIRPDFLEIVDALHERGILINQIYSNGALVNEKLLHKLSRKNIHPTFVMSYDGTEGWHNWLRGVKGAEENVNRAFALCRDMGFRTLANFTIHKGNMHTLRDTVNHLASLGVRQIKTSLIENLGEWKIHGGGQLITFKELFQTYLDYLPHYFEDGMPIARLMSFIDYDPARPDEYRIIGYHESYDPEETLLCGYIRRSSYISPEGRALMCGLFSSLKMEKGFPKLSEMKLADCIKTPEYMYFIEMKASDFLKANDECRTCRFTKHCYGGCRGLALLENEENLMGKTPILCELYYGGWIQKIADTMKRLRPSAECPIKDTSLL